MCKKAAVARKILQGKAKLSTNKCQKQAKNKIK